MKCSIYIPVTNERDALRRTLRSLIPEKGEHEVFVVDRGSADGSIEAAGEHSWVKVLSGKDGMLSVALNQAASEGTGDVLLFLLPGSVLERGWSEALNKFFSQDVDAGSFDVRDAEGGRTLIGKVRQAAHKLGHRLIGGPAGLTGLAVRRSTFDSIHGFTPVPDFEWLVFAKRIEETGGTLKPIPHGLIVAPRPGAHQADAWDDLMDDLKAAWRYRKTESFDAVRCRRNAASVVLVGYDLLENVPVSDYFGYAREKLLMYNVERVQSYRSAANRVFLGGQNSTRTVGQPSGFRVDNHYRTDLGKRLEQLFEDLQIQGSDTFLIVRDSCKDLSHKTLRKLSESNDEYTGKALTNAAGTEWQILWFDVKALPLFIGLEGDFSIQALEKAFHDNRQKLDVLETVPRLETEHDARALYYSGLVDRLPGAPA
jgi:glycosyltransferase involved in cell wall biosynthesis